MIDCNYIPTSGVIKIDSLVTNRSVQLKVLEVNDYAFYNNDSITALVVNHKGSIGDYAFYDCDALTTVTASNNGNIGWSAFGYCRALTTASINNTGSIGNYAFANCNMGNSLTIGENVTTIGDYAFIYNKGLKEVVIPDNIGGMGDCAFAGCSLLESVKIGKGISVLNRRLFSGCSSLSSLTIPSNIKTINDYVFDGCTSLSDVTFEDAADEIATVLTLGSNGSSPMFADCPLDEVYIGRKLSYETSSSYGYSPFYRNTSLRSVKITDLETQIYDNEFYGCSNLQEFTCGDGVTQIGKWAFSGCSTLKSYASGTSVKSIGAEAFSDCTALTSFITLAAVPPVCGNQALDDINKWECSLYVPAESVDDYQAADQWKEFFFIEADAGIEDVVVDEAKAIVVGYYNMQGVMSAEPWKGLNIVVYSDGSHRKMFK